MRTFTEAEARDVFARATREQQAAHEAEATAGLTLDELQEIGEASGLDPALVARAAQAVALGAPETRRHALGPVPTAVGRTVRLAAPPSDALWERLAADARQTFRATGRVSATGDAREWRNGHLRVTLRPDGDGSRLDLDTRRTGVAPFVGAAAFVALAGVLAAVLGLLGGGSVAAGLLGILLGTAVLAALVARQRTWAATRDGQMQALTDRAATVAPLAAEHVSKAATPAPVLDLDAWEDAGEAAPGPRRRSRS